MASHLTPELYRLLLRGELSPQDLLEQARRHLLEVCGSGRDASPSGEAGPRPAAAELQEGEDRESLAGLARREKRWARMQHERRRARENLRHLRSHPRGAWIDLVENAQSRFRTRAFAELLVVESRSRLPADPDEATHLAALVPVVLRWIPGSEGEPWAAELNLRAAIRHAQARHAAGDPAAAPDLSRLRHHLRTTPLPDPHHRRLLADLDWTPEGEPVH